MKTNFVDSMDAAFRALGPAYIGSLVPIIWAMATGNNCSHSVAFNFGVFLSMLCVGFHNWDYGKPTESAHSQDAP